MNEERQWAEAILKEGDEVSFRRLYRRHTPRLFNIALRMLGSRADAEDIVQETWVRAVRQLGRFRWQSAFSTWLTGIGLNLCRDHLRRRKRLSWSALEALPEPSAAAAPSGLRLDLEEAVQALPEGYRMVLLLHDLEGWTHREIAHGMGISEGTSKSQLFNARRAVKASLKGEGNRNERRTG
ncbi:MAG TPA: RNA polymerase sigma factor [Acidobacteriota bacterium]|nr:RNA polymerase sigma factor [Acidobacteriota bacterium]